MHSRTGLLGFKWGHSYMERALGVRQSLQHPRVSGWVCRSRHRAGYSIRCDAAMPSPQGTFYPTSEALEAHPAVSQACLGSAELMHSFPLHSTFPTDVNLSLYTSVGLLLPAQALENKPNSTTNIQQGLPCSPNPSPLSK